MVGICLSDIPKEKIKVAENGKKYLNIVVSQMREPDKYEQTHTVFVSQSKDEREAREDKVYIGKGKMMEFTPQATNPADIENMPASSSEDIDDLPF